MSCVKRSIGNPFRATARATCKPRLSTNFGTPHPFTIAHVERIDSNRVRADAVQLPARVPLRSLLVATAKYVLLSRGLNRMTPIGAGAI